MQNTIKTFEPNLRGRDFVVGDMHGSFSLFEKLLESLGFDSVIDRMFSVGDLVDRGPDSLSCLRLIREEWFHPVRSNHEQMMIEAFNGGGRGEYWYPNGGGWGLQAYVDYGNLIKHGVQPCATSHEIVQLAAQAAELPYLITINRPDGKKFHVLHAELPVGELQLTDADLSSPGRVQELATIQRQEGGDSFLWSRFHYSPFNDRDLSDEQAIRERVAQKYRAGTGPFNDQLSHIISGHTIVQRPVTLFGQTNIDTCAFGAYQDQPTWQGLTCVDLSNWAFYQATVGGLRVLEPLTINRTDSIALYNSIQGNT